MDPAPPAEAIPGTLGRPDQVGACLRLWRRRHPGSRLLTPTNLPNGFDENKQKRIATPGAKRILCAGYESTIQQLALFRTNVVSPTSFAQGSPTPLPSRCGRQCNIQILVLGPPHDLAEQASFDVVGERTELPFRHCNSARLPQLWRRIGRSSPPEILFIKFTNTPELLEWIETLLADKGSRALTGKFQAEGLNPDHKVF